MANTKFKNFMDFFGNNRNLLKVQLAISFLAFSVLSWQTVSILKRMLLKHYYTFSNYQWTLPFFHPYESDLFNYLITAIVIGLSSIIIYALMKNKRLISEDRTLIKTVFILSLVAAALFPLMSHSVKFILSLVVTCLPLFYFINLKQLCTGRRPYYMAVFLLLIISIEPVLVIIGPVFLANEYKGLDGMTRVKKDKYLDNSAFLEQVSGIDINSVKAFYNLSAVITGNKIKNDAEWLDFLYDLSDKNIKGIQGFIVLSYQSNYRPWTSSIPKEISYKKVIEDLKKVDMKELDDFFVNNALEYSLQNMSRGQINHIGHVLNPINEYRLGRPLNEIYMQYGLGNTFILKWTMELFGGISIENYYKCYFFYLLYFYLFLLMLLLLFKEAIYIYAGLAFLSFAYFFQGYVGFILAPGILPTVHMLDIFLVVLMLFFFRSGNPVYAVLASVSSLTAIIINRQFGIILAFAMLASLILYTIENKKGLSKAFWFLAAAITCLLSAIVFHFSNTGTLSHTFSYFLLGLFSWHAKEIIIMLTLCYLIISYFFIFMLKDSRHPLKYLYLFVFTYTQGLFVYYYWSGLTNHIPIVLPFAGLQLLIMIYLTQTLFKDRPVLPNFMNITPVAFILSLALVFSLVGFYKEKLKFTNIFRYHMTYRWKFDGANLTSTINPVSIKESVDLIRGYDTNDKGIYILSKYDNILPYLSGKYSKMPFFDMQWHLLSDRESNEAIEAIRLHKPKYLFVDTGIHDLEDPWAALYNNRSYLNERASRIGRYYELEKVFNAVASDYAKVEGGTLLSVYSRK